MSNPIVKFVQPILDVIPAPKTDNLDGFMKAYAKILGEFDDDVLELASDTIIRTMKHKSMPLPAECLEACREAAEAIRLRKIRANGQRRRIPEQFMWTPEMAKKADQLFASAWGRKAVADGVEIALWDFLVKHQRWPNGFEYDKLKAQSLAVQAETRSFLNIQEENGGIKPDFMGFMGTMNTARDRLRELAKAGI